jgi:hypothetical protein
MKQTLFTCYANLSLRDNPEDLKLLPQILHKHFHLPTPAIFDKLLFSVVDFANEPNMAYAENYLLSLKQYQDTFRFTESEIAFEAVYGYQDDYCMDFSDYGQNDGGYLSPCEQYLPGRHGFIDPDFFRGPDERQGRLKCFQCEQLYVIGILDQIIKGEEFFNINGLKEFLQNASNHDQGTITLRDGKINVIKFWAGLFHNSGSFIIGPDQNYPYKHVLNQYIRSMIAYDLGAYLSGDHKNINRIKRCSKCNIFYISETSAKRELSFCSDQCRYNYHNTQRTKDGYFKDYKDKRGFYKY